MALVDYLIEAAEDTVSEYLTQEQLDAINASAKATHDLDEIVDKAVSKAAEAATDTLWSELVSSIKTMADNLKYGIYEED